MPITSQEMRILQQREHEFLALVENSSREQLSQCSRFLAMYLVLYRQKFGELPSPGYSTALASRPLNSDLLRIISEGMKEASAMLKTVLMQPVDDNDHPATATTRSVN